MNTHAILCCLVKSLNYVAYRHILIKRVTEEVKRMLTAVNVSRVFTQSLTLVLLCFIEAARTLLLNNIKLSSTLNTTATTFTATFTVQLVSKQQKISKDF